MSNTDFEHQLRQRLHHAASFTKPISNHDLGSSDRAPQNGSRQQRLAWLVSAAAVTIIAIGGLWLLVGSSTESPPVVVPRPEPNSTRTMADGPLDGRSGQAMVWTGDEVLIWGGSEGNNQRDDGAAYDPTTDTWRSLREAPIEARSHAAVAWTGEEMIVWGGSGGGQLLDDGAAYKPATDTWRIIAPSVLNPALQPATVWTGTEMLIVGGLDTGPNGQSGAAYDPMADTWRRMPPAPGFSGGPAPQVVWTGDKAYFLLSPQGMNANRILATYDPMSNLWEIVEHPFPPSFPPLGPFPLLAWTGDELLALSAPGDNLSFAYNPTTEVWRSFEPNPTEIADSAIGYHALWSGSEALLWSGDTGHAFDPSTGTWRVFPAGDLDARETTSVVWTGEFLIGWGGFQSTLFGSSGADDGIVYAPPRP